MDCQRLQEIRFCNTRPGQFQHEVVASNISGFLSIAGPLIGRIGADQASCDLYYKTFQRSLVHRCDLPSVKRVWWNPSSRLTRIGWLVKRRGHA